MKRNFSTIRGSKNNPLKSCLLTCIVLLITNPVFGIDSLQVHWSTYIGGSEGFWGVEDDIHGMVEDAAGNVYVVGDTRTSNLPKRTNQHPSDNTCAFAAKLGSSGSILWSTYVGGTNYGQGFDITIDAGGDNVYITGHSDANDLPGVIDPGWGSGAFVSKLGTNTGNVEWTRFLTNGAFESRGNALYMHDGFIYVAGYSRAYQLVGAANDFAGGAHDAFISKLTPAGTVVKSVWFGGSELDDGNGIYVDAQGNIYLAGRILSESGNPEYNLPGQLNTWRGDHRDGFACKLDSDFHVLWSRFIGGENDDYVYFIIGDDLGNLWIAGNGYSDDLEGTIIVPYNGYSWPGGDGFLTKLNANGTVDWTSYAGYSGSAISQPKLTQCRKIITLRGNILLMFDADMGFHQWLIEYDSFMGPHCYSAKSCNDILIDESMTITLCGFTAAECSNYPNRTNEHSGQGLDGFVVKAKPKGTFFHFNDDDESGWLASPPEAWDVSNGKYVFTGIGGSRVRNSYYQEEVFNFSYEAQVKKISGNSSAEFGMNFRHNGTSATNYRFCINTLGQYAISEEVNGNVRTLVGFKASPAIKTGMGVCNLLRVSAQDSILDFSINGKQVETINVVYEFAGSCGLYAYDTEGVTDIVEFDNVYICPHKGFPTGVFETDDRLSIPKGYSLENFPNPFNPATSITFTIPTSSRVTVKIVNERGREIATLIDENKPAGRHVIQWNGKTTTGSICPSGLYFCFLKTDDFFVSRKLMLLR
ncbi:T9SS type A sorting domain-containing protein [candidate division KSB1 bacterium]|nr:T9SS type A sorting domain-containing protein [candidate division KSB1 bacterium]